MSFDNALQEITSGLTGDTKNDVKYLMEQCEKYKKHEYAQEILRAIGRIIHELVPEELKKTFENEYNNFNLSIEKTLEEVNFQMYKNDHRKALEIIEALIKKIEEMGFYKDDQVSEYHCFNNILEEILYKELFKPEKTIRQIPNYYATAYFMYGQLLFEHKKFVEARKPLEIAGKYNPFDTNSKIELAETYKVEKNWDKYLSINKQVYECAYTNEDLCRYYRNLGYYYIEQENYELAISLYIMSILFLDLAEVPDLVTAQNQRMMQLNMARNQLEYITVKLGKNIEFSLQSLKDSWKLTPRFDSSFKNTEWYLDISETEINDNETLNITIIKQNLEKNNIPFGPNPKILSVLKDLGQDAIYKKENVIARSIYKLLFELTNNEMYTRVIKALPKTNRTNTKKTTPKKSNKKKGKK
jgi:tetratricopeptide (TPR) repeat protein